MNYEHLQVAQSEEGVARLTLERPPLNVLNIPMMREFGAALDELADDETLRVLVITGAGRAFCAGVDVADHTADRVQEMLEVFHGALRQVMNLPAPVVAALNGAALGGGLELALACDVIVAVDDAKIGQPEIQLAVFPPIAAVLMPRLIGRHQAMELVLTGKTITAAEGHRRGLINQTHSADDFEAEVEELVAQLSGLSAPVLQMTKRVVHESLDLRLDAAIDHAESVYLTELMQLEDPHEGLAAFMEKRGPEWKHR